MAGLVKTILLSLLFLAYPFLVHRGLGSGLGWAVPACLAVVMLRRAAGAPNRAAAIAALCAALLLAAGALLFGAETAKLIPAGIHAFLFWLFGHTLRGGPSLVERIVRLQFPEFPPGVAAYCRQVTAVWTLFFGINVAACVYLALVGPDLAWTAYNGGVIFVLMSLLLAGEWVYRHLRFPDLEIPSPRESVDAMIRNGRRVWREILSENRQERAAP